MFLLFWILPNKERTKVEDQQEAHKEGVSKVPTEEVTVEEEEEDEEEKEKEEEEATAIMTISREENIERRYSLGG